MTHTSLDGQPLRGLWSALDATEGETTMTPTNRYTSPSLRARAAWYALAVQGDPGHLSAFRRLCDADRGHALRTILTLTAEAAAPVGVV